MRRKWLSLLLAAAMLCSLLPAASAAATQLPTPEVEWLTEDKTFGEGETAETYQIGQVILTNVPEGGPSYHMMLKDSQGNILEEVTEGTGDESQLGIEIISVGWYMEEPLPSDTYTLEVYYVGNGDTYADSDAITVQYTYTAPEAGFQTPVDVKWGEDDFASFTLSDKGEYGPRDSLFVEFGYFETETSDDLRATRHMTIKPDPTESNRERFTQRFNEFVTENGEGYYRFRLRALSHYIAEKAHSPWSEWSEARYISGED